MDRVAHDLNNELSAIVNYSLFVHDELAKAVAKGDDTWAQPLRDLEVIRAAAQRACLLTHELRSVA